jgi:hypothetical protein
MSFIESESRPGLRRTSPSPSPTTSTITTRRTSTTTTTTTMPKTRASMSTAFHAGASGYPSRFHSS